MRLLKAGFGLTALSFNVAAKWLGASLQGAWEDPTGAAAWAEGPRARVTRSRLTQLQKPALPVWVEERVRQVIPIILRDLKGFILNTFIQVL